MFHVLVISVPYLLKGAVVTLWLSLVTISLGTLLGFTLGTVGAVGPWPLRAAVTGYVFLLRGIPILVVMFLGYYAFPALGYRVNAYVAVAAAMIVYVGAFVSEIVRGAILALPASQIAAAKSLGMRRWPMLRQVVFPQAFRLAIPPLLNTALTTIKQTSYVSVVGAWELSYAAREVVERTLAAFEIFLGVMALYFVICYPLSLLARNLERRYAFAS
ncbi:MAG: amino acid ABC transporter permease [Alphaproteobacteria bacterium]